jgi:hypothetical protein
MALSKRRTRIYLFILAAAIAVWAPLYPIFYSLNADTSNLATLFWETIGFNRCGYDAEVWRNMVRFVTARGDGFVSAAIIPINMGSFSSTWGNVPSAQEQMFFTLASGHVSIREYFQMLQEVHLLSRPYEHDHDTRTQRSLPVGLNSKGAFERATAEIQQLPILPCSQDLDRYARLIGLKFAVNYGAPITPKNPLLTDIDEMVVSLRRARMRPVVYITPLNIDGARRFAGAAIVNQINANLEVVRQVARMKGWDLIDLSGALPASDFITRACACEHVNAAGRTFIAQSVAAALQHTAPPAFPRQAADANRPDL